MLKTTERISLGFEHNTNVSLKKILTRRIWEKWDIHINILKQTLKKVWKLTLLNIINNCVF